MSTDMQQTGQKITATTETVAVLVEALEKISALTRKGYTEPSHETIIARKAISDAMNISALTKPVAQTPDQPLDQTPPERFALRNLSVLNYSNGFTSWHYRADGGRNVPRSSTPRSSTPFLIYDFWRDAMTLLAPGDRIFISAGESAYEIYLTETAIKVIHATV